MKKVFRICLVVMLLAILMLSIRLWRDPLPKETPPPTPAVLENPSMHPPARDTRPFEMSPIRKRQQGGDQLRNSPFLRTIIDNNLFRPLGWTLPRPTEPYRLLGTLLPRSANTPAKAILQTTAGNQTYIVSIGEKIDASTEVVSIEPKQVTLSTEGQQRTLRLRSGF